MRRHIAQTLLLLLLFAKGFSQTGDASRAKHWADSVYESLSDAQRLAQLIVIRLSALDPQTKKVLPLLDHALEEVRTYNVGAVCLFQGGPLTQAQWINQLQQAAKTPILFCIDGENGLGMRMDSVVPLARQMTLGATGDPDLMYRYGQLVGAQCRRMGIQVNFAPVVDVNNNPLNPVINDRSFGEDKAQVSRLALAYMQGLQEAGVMACAKHFPGHGDVSVDSHLDLPQVTKDRAALDSLELVPFRALIAGGVGSVMVGHLQVPALDPRPGIASSLSEPIVSRLLKKDLHFKGLVFTDALEMQAVAKFFPNGLSSVASLKAGNDLLCLPGDVASSLDRIQEALRHHELKWKDLRARIKKILVAKYMLGISHPQPVSLDHLTEDLNQGVVELNRTIAQKAITVARQQDTLLLPAAPTREKIAYVALGISADNEITRRLRLEYQAHIYYFDFGLDSALAQNQISLLSHRYDRILIGIHNTNRFPSGRFGMSQAALKIVEGLMTQGHTTTLVFGNPYLLQFFCQAPNLVCAYDDSELTQGTALDLLEGKFEALGKLPVTVCPALPRGTGVQVRRRRLLPPAPAQALGFRPQGLLAIDSICREAITKQAAPGCVVLVAKDGRLAFWKSYGYLTYDKAEPVYPETIYDLASVTKICATTLAVMKLYEDHKLDIKKTLGDYLPDLRGTNKQDLNIYDVLLHQAGLNAFIPFYRETLDGSAEGWPLPSIYRPAPGGNFQVRVADHLYMRRDWVDTMYARIRSSEVGPRGKYIYSDNDFIYMGKLVEAASGQRLDQYVQQQFYAPLSMTTTGFLPRNRFGLERIAPTEREPIFRRQLLRGDVHDPGAAMFGGISGHAGLFSGAYDLAVLMQMLLNGRVMDGVRYLNQETIDLFTQYHSDSSRRGLGFDKPEKNNATRPDPYPAKQASSQAFGHTGFTGTCVWVDPKYQLIFVFLSNRVNPSGTNNQLSSLNIRIRLLEAIYKSLDVYDTLGP